jgi:hypothetical protein
MEVFGWRAQSSNSQPLLRFTDVRRALVHGCRAPQSNKAFLRVEGGQSAAIRLLSNDLTEARQAVELADQVPAEAVEVR